MPEPTWVYLVVEVDQQGDRMTVLACTNDQTAEEIAGRAYNAHVERVILIGESGE
jgi:hypothetical protein